MHATVADLYDLSHTIAASLLERYKYPWEALTYIKEFILELGPTLPSDEFDNPADGICVFRQDPVSLKIISRFSRHH